jgi:hypothetical protein
LTETQRNQRMPKPRFTMVVQLAAAGYHVVREPFLTSFDAYMCLVDDPDGNTVLVTAG